METKERVSFNKKMLEKKRNRVIKDLRILNELFENEPESGIDLKTLVKRVSVFDIEFEPSHQIEIWEKGSNSMWIEECPYHGRFGLTDEFFEACKKYKLYIHPVYYLLDGDENDEFSHQYMLRDAFDLTDEDFYSLIKERYNCVTDEQVQETVNYLVQSSIVIATPINN